MRVLNRRTPGNASGDWENWDLGEYLGCWSRAQTEEANISRVKVDLPEAAPIEVDYVAEGMHFRPVRHESQPVAPQLPVVASAKAITPILPVPTSRQGSNLSGPAYFVSHGNEAFPQLILVLQGYGITIDLVGDTFISKSGITSSTFAHVPDAPVSPSELTLPQGKFSALRNAICARSRVV